MNWALLAGRPRDDATDSAPSPRLNDLPSIGRIGPRADDVDAPYWDGLRNGELRIHRCAECRTWWSFPGCCDAVDRAMRVFGGVGDSLHTPFEHIYRHRRRSRITEGIEEIHMGRVGGHLFDFMKKQTPKAIIVGDWNACQCWI